MRPDKWKRNRGRKYEKSNDGATQENKVEVKSDNTPENTQSASKETPGDAEQNKAVSKDSALTKDSSLTKDTSLAKNENAPAPALRRETDALKETKKFSKRQIFSNWEKYDEPIAPVVEDEINNSDFDLLIQQNISGSGHFKFKSERQWDSESVTVNQDLFTLNLEQLSAGLECIPYYKRLNLPRDLFSENELQRMDNAAKKQEKFYEKLLTGETVEPISSFMDKLKECIQEPLAENPEFSLENRNQEMAFMDMGEFMIKESAIEASNDIFDVHQVRTSKRDGNNFSETKEIEMQLGDCKISEDQSNKNSINEKFVEECAISKNEVGGIKIDDNKEKESQVVKNDADAVKLDENKAQKSEVTKNDSTVTKVCESKIQENEKRKKRNRGREGKNVEKKTNERAEVNNVKKQTEPLELPKDATNVARDNSKEKSVENGTSFSNEAVVKEDKALKIPEVKASLKTKENKSKNVSKVKGFEEEEDVLDSLLSLKEPSISPFDTSKKKSMDEENDTDNLLTDVSSIVIHEKKENLEEWLDSMLDD